MFSNDKDNSKNIPKSKSDEIISINHLTDIYEPNILLARTITSNDEPITFTDEPQEYDPVQEPVPEPEPNPQPTTGPGTVPTPVPSSVITPLPDSGTITTPAPAPQNTSNPQPQAAFTPQVQNEEIKVMSTPQFTGNTPAKTIAPNIVKEDEVLGIKTDLPTLKTVTEFANTSHAMLDSQISRYPIQYLIAMAATLLAIIMLTWQYRHDTYRAKFYSSLTRHRLHV